MSSLAVLARLFDGKPANGRAYPHCRVPRCPRPRPPRRLRWRDFPFSGVLTALDVGVTIGDVEEPVRNHATCRRLCLPPDRSGKKRKTKEIIVSLQICGHTLHFS